MIIAGFFFLLLLTGKNASSLELQDSDQQTLNETIPEGNNTSSLELQGYDQQMSNETIPEGKNASSLELQDYNQQMLNETIPKDKEEERCSFEAVANYLNLTKDNPKYTLSRPVKDYKRHTYLYIDIKIFAILDVRERDQTLVSYIWGHLSWNNRHISWDPDQFCGLDHFLVPTALLWMPDLTIEEMTEKDKATPSPYLSINYYGWIDYRNDQVVQSICKIYVYKFPFDIQRCNLTIKSVMHSDKEIILLFHENSSLITQWSREVMQKQYEWLFLNMSATENTVNHFGFNQTTLVYTITMKRRSVLYIANFLVPVLFFFLLDLASFLISDTGGEKLGFKITVLLAVTVMQLILNEILPSSSSRMPLIAIYCIGIFALMLLSLLETIFVMHLIEKDSAAQRYPSDEVPSVAKEDSSDKLMVSFDVEKTSAELQKIEKAFNLLNSNGNEEKSGYWSRRVKIINRVFFIMYIIVATLFLCIMFSLWTISDNV